MVNKFVFLYLDDILIFSQNKEQHTQHILQVLKRLLENRLFVKAEKCEFSCDTTTFLGYIISTGALSMDPTKVEAVTKWPTPEDRKSLQRFLGFANFCRRFLCNYSTVAALLTALTSTKCRFSWNDSVEEVFNHLKNLFTTADPEVQFVGEVDVSNIGVGAVLSQRSPRMERHIRALFFSHCLSHTEQNYDRGIKSYLRSTWL